MNDGVSRLLKDLEILDFRFAKYRNNKDISS